MARRPLRRERRSLSRPLSLALAVPLAFATLAVAGPATTRIDLDGRSPAAKRLQEAVAAADEGSAAKVLVPERLRFARDGSLKRRLFASADTNRRTWRIRLEHGRDCGGSNACFVGLLAAGRRELPDAGWRRVALADDTRGAFRGVSCGASCAPANIVWRKYRHRYVLQLAEPPGDPGSARERRAMIAMANSAIAAGPR